MLSSWPGAVLCIVVKVVVNDRTDGAGDENVLPSPPGSCVLIAPPPVVNVPAFERPASLCVVPECVAMVGAIDLVPPVQLPALSSMDVVKDVWLCVLLTSPKLCESVGASEFGDNGPCVPCPLPAWAWLLDPCPAFDVLLLFLFLTAAGEELSDDFIFVRRFMNLPKRRPRECPSTYC